MFTGPVPETTSPLARSGKQQSVMTYPVRGGGRAVVGAGWALALALMVAACGSGLGGSDESPILGAGEPSPSPGDTVVLAAPTAASVSLRPPPSRAEQDLPAMYAKGCRQTNKSSKVLSCTWGKKGAATKIAVVGDSKLAQWTSAIDPLIPKQDWRVVSYMKSACDFADVDQDLRTGVPHPTCRPWVKKVLAKLTGPERPDVVVLSQRGTRAGDDPEQRSEQRARMRTTMVATWKKLTAVGIRIVVIADNPDPAMEVHDCVAKYGQDAKRCSFERAAGVTRSAAPLQLEVTRKLGGRQVKPGDRIPDDFKAPVYVDLVDEICKGATCPPVAGDLLIYRQGSHLTATFVASLSARLLRLFEAAGVPTRR